MRCAVLVILILSPSVRPSVRLSVTLVDCVHTVRPTITISSPYGSPMILASGGIPVIPKFEGDHPQARALNEGAYVQIGNFRHLSRRISETVQDTTKVSIDH